MDTIIENAVKGQRKAMELLYENNKQKVFYVALLLLDNEKNAAEATSSAFKNVWESITAHNIKTESEFKHLVIRKAADFCKRAVEKENPKAFRMPNNRNFLIKEDISITDTESFKKSFKYASGITAFYIRTGQCRRVYARTACKYF